MLAAIIIIAVVIGILFITAAAALGFFIYSIVKKNEDGRKKSLMVLIPSAILWLILIGVNTFLGITWAYKNREAIIDTSARLPALLKELRGGE